LVCGALCDVPAMPLEVTLETMLLTAFARLLPVLLLGAWAGDLLAAPAPDLLSGSGSGFSPGLSGVEGWSLQAFVFGP
jgi:hypothetical protein